MTNLILKGHLELFKFYILFFDSQSISITHAQTQTVYT